MIIDPIIQLVFVELEKIVAVIRIYSHVVV